MQKIRDEQMIRYLNKDTWLFCFMTLHCCVMGTVICNEPEVLR